MQKFGAESIQVNAAGDISLFGGYYSNKRVSPWKIGIRDPEDSQKVLKVFEKMDGTIATSGTYEKGAHIWDPKTGLIAIGALSATAIGPDGGICEALATGLVVAGPDGATWFNQPELAEYGAWVIDRYDRTAWSVGKL